MPLFLHNTLSRERERFEPLDPANVRMYVCGPTVYDLPHIGNARPIVVFDVLYRLLRLLYGDRNVVYVRNITDVDDKINAAAQARGVSISQVTEETTKAFHDDIARLGVLPPDVEPRATEHITEMIDLIERLIAADHAYAADGHVLFNVPSKSDYGRLSGRNRDDMIAGARVEVAPYKKDPADFVLWKPSDPEIPGWGSPWGRGRPGWHIECSAMSERHLGVPFDIHGGGQDLIFPHHENEIAQSCAAHPGAEFARYWVHNGYVQIKGEKMSKSIGNVWTVRELLQEGHRGEAIRFALLSAHYRQPLDLSKDDLRQAKQSLDRLYTALDRAADVAAIPPDPPFDLATALEEDLNTPLAISRLHERASELNRAPDSEERAILKGEIIAGGSLLGVLQQDPEAWFHGEDMFEPGELQKNVMPDKDWIEEKIRDRAAAREAKDYSTADGIRDELEHLGILLEDMPDGSTDWKRL